jgi:glucose-6-phosphate isomerase
MKLHYDNSLVKDRDIVKYGKKLSTEIETAKFATYADPHASVVLPFDTNYLNEIKTIVKKKLALKPEYLVVVGIGGSNLGTIAVQEAVLGRLYNQLSPKTKVLYADTVDPDSLNNLIKIITPTLQRNKSIILNVVTKSGGTTETIANFKVLLNVLKKYKKNYKKYVVVTTDSYSKLWHASKPDFDILEIPENVGGRYSVFSAVGLFPLAILGVNINQLLAGARNIQKSCFSSDIKKNPAALSAIIHYLNYKKKKNISDLFLFSPELESIGKWYRQLMGESIGKEHNKQNKMVNMGITPTYSIGSTDLHSMAQLYLGGPYDKFTTFVSIKKYNSSLKTPNDEKYLDMIKGKTFSKLMGAILQGVKIAFKKTKRPFLEIQLDDHKEDSIGEILQFKMIEMMYLGFLLNLNPFNQPNVEKYKVETKKILKGR